MADRTLTINHAGGDSETYTINRDKFAGVREMSVDGDTVTVDHAAVPKVVAKETTFGGSKSITIKRDIEPLLSKVVGGAAVGLSLRDLNDKAGNNKVVRVRRTSDNAEADFKAKEVANGTLTDFVNVGKNYVGHARFQGISTSKVNFTSSFTLEASESWSIKLGYIGKTGVTGLFGGTSSNTGFWFAATNTIGLTDDSGSYQALNFGNALALKLGQHYEIEFFNVSGEGVRVKVDGITQTTAPKNYGDITLNKVGPSRGRSGDRVIENVRIDLNGDGTLDYSYAGDGNQASNWTDRVGSNDGTPTAQVLTYNNEFTDGFVETWYDQSGNGNDATQETAGNQPKIVDAGSLVTTGGNPTVDFYNNSRLATTAFTDGSASSSFSVVNNQSATSTRKIFHSKGSFPDTGVVWNYRGDDSVGEYNFVSFDGSATNLTFTDLTSPFYFVSSTIINSSKDIFINGLSKASSSDSFVANDGILSIGSTGFGTGFDIQEIIIYNSDQSANRAAIEANINNQYDIY